MNNEMNKETILHICRSEDWQSAQHTKLFMAESLKNEGFIHCSRSDQVLQVANTYYMGISDLVLLWIDPQKLSSELRWEESNGDLYPHLYGPLNLDAVIASTEFSPGSDGIFHKLPSPN